MKYIIQLITFSFLIIAGQTAYAGVSSETSPPSAKLGTKDIEKLVKPIALYPDTLLQSVLAASTFPEQILDAAMFNEQAKDPETIKNQPWDQSVKAIANYPSILSKLASDLDWTISLGSAFINQNEEVRDAIQDLRLRAKKLGNLRDSDKQDIIEEKSPAGTTIIRIEPAEPEIIYVPVETSTVVYENYTSSSSNLAPLATFGLGMALGYAMGDDDDDHYYYGGYYGPGFWNGNAAEDWVDYRRDRWDDAYDFANDRQDFRQDSAEDWREYRQDLGQKQQEWKSEAKNRASNMSPEQRAQATSRANNAKSSWQGKTPDQKKQSLQSSKGTFSKTGSADYSNFDRDSANQRLSQARSNPQVQQRAQNYKSTASPRTSGSAFSNNYARGGGLSGMNSGGNTANRSYSRGSYSQGRASGSFNSANFNRGSGSMSRGGGGFSRGGGGRRR